MVKYKLYCSYFVKFRFLFFSLIMQVIIQGFRSYRDQTIIEPFSPKHNIIGKDLMLQGLCFQKLRQ